MSWWFTSLETTDAVNLEIRCGIPHWISYRASPFNAAYKHTTLLDANIEMKHGPFGTSHFFVQVSQESAALKLRQQRNESTMLLVYSRKKWRMFHYYKQVSQGNMTFHCWMGSLIITMNLHGIAGWASRAHGFPELSGNLWIHDKTERFTSIESWQNMLEGRGK